MMSEYQTGMGNAAEPRGPSLVPDQPISTFGQDYLDRGTFASRLAKQLRSYADERCLVVALYAPWGAGKSSLLHLLDDELSKDAGTGVPSPIVIKFNPWHFSNMDSLLSMFFRELQTNIGTSNSKLEQKIQTSLRALSLLLAVGEFSPTGGSWFRSLSQLFKRGAEAVKDRAQSLSRIKQQINLDLRALDRRIFVLIDDIDRLDQESMRFMFRLIRLNADFDRMTYVLAFDKTVVSSVLKQEQWISGYDYLEKIVQVGFDIPPAEPSKLQSSLSEALGNIGFWTYIDKESDVRWLDLKRGALNNLIRTPRDVVRYVNGLAINGSLVIDEVNPIDFAGIEAVRTFAPEVYRFITDNRDLVIGQIGSALPLVEQGTPEELREKLDNMCSSCKPEIQAAILEICRQLFPAVDDSYAPSSPYHGNPQQWREEKRICTASYFPRYFYLRPFDKEVTEAQFTAILRDAGDHVQLAARLEELIATGKIDSFLERLSHRVAYVSEEHTEATVLALFGAGEGLEGGATFADQLSTIGFVIHRILFRLPETKRMDILLKAVTEAASLGPLVHFARSYGDETGRWKLVGEREWTDIRTTLVARISAAAEEMTLGHSHHLGVLLYSWKDWAAVEEVQRFVGRLTESDDGVLLFLQAMLAQRSTSASKYVSQTGWYLPVNDVRKFIDPEILTEVVQRIRKEGWANLTESQRAVIDVPWIAQGGELDSP